MSDTQESVGRPEESPSGPGDHPPATQPSVESIQILARALSGVDGGVLDQAGRQTRVTETIVAVRGQAPLDHLEACPAVEGKVKPYHHPVVPQDPLRHQVMGRSSPRAAWDDHDDPPGKSFKCGVGGGGGGGGGGMGKGVGG